MSATELHYSIVIVLYHHFGFVHHDRHGLPESCVDSISNALFRAQHEIDDPAFRPLSDSYHDCRDQGRLHLDG